MGTDERRRAILDCASRLFRHYGHAKTTVADIAREAHVGVGTVYLAFPSKESIVEELSSSIHVRVLRAMREVADARAGDSFSERLSGVLECRVVTFQTLVAEGQHACELVHCKDAAVKAVQARFQADERALLQRILEDAKRTAEIDAIDTKRAAALIQRAYATLSPPWLFEHGIDDARRAAYDMARLLLLGLMTRATGDEPARRAPRAPRTKPTSPRRRPR